MDKNVEYYNTLITNYLEKADLSEQGLDGVLSKFMNISLYDDQWIFRNIEMSEEEMEIYRNKKIDLSHIRPTGTRISNKDERTTFSYDKLKDMLNRIEDLGIMRFGGRKI